MYKKVPNVVTPSEEASLWRYMDFARFASILDRKAVYFARADEFNDPFEGSLSRWNAARKPRLTEHLVPQDIQEKVKIRSLPQFTFISCWHKRDYESDAMWKLYSREFDGIAVKTDFRFLRDSLTVDTVALIHEIVVAPFAKDWFLQLVKSVAGRYGLEAPIKRSSLAISPRWGRC